MTHKDIKTKFMIEYDKANVTSSYPSLTDYEIATILDKAYNALIAQKVTGNNIRRSGFETDIKSISDLQPLVVTTQLETKEAPSVEINICSHTLPEDFLYYVESYIKEADGDEISPIQLVTHETAQRFVKTKHNLPWIKIPVGCIEDNSFYVIYDPIDYPTRVGNISDGTWMTYIKKPYKFVEDAEEDEFELNDTMAEELITLAIMFALENIESTRLASKLNTRGLEA